MHYLIILLLSLATIHVSAQNDFDSLMDIQEVTINANLRVHKSIAGMQITSIDSISYQQRANISLADVLSSNTGLFIKNHGRGALSTVSFRGTAPSHTQVMWNGLAISSPLTGMVDFSLIPSYIIDKVELKHGGASISEVSGGIGGLINIDNDVHYDSTFQLELLQGSGSYSTYDNYVKAGWGNKTFQLNSILYYNWSANDYPYVNHSIVHIDPVSEGISNPTSKNKNADYFKKGILQSFYYKVNTKNTIAVNYWGQHADRSLPAATSYEGPEFSNLNKQLVTDHRLNSEWNHYKHNSKFTFQSGFLHTNMLYRTDNYVSGLGVTPALYSLSKMNSFQQKAIYKINLRPSLTFESSLKSLYSSVLSLDTIANDGYSKERYDHSFYLSIQKSFASRFFTNIAVRQELVNKKISPFSPYLGFSFLPFRKYHTRIQGNISRTFKMPTLNDLYWVPGGNTKLKPELGWAGEAGIGQLWQFRSLVIDLEVNSFRSEIENWIIWLPGFKGYWEPRNIQKVLTYGYEGFLKFSVKKINWNIGMQANYALTHSLNKEKSELWGELNYNKQLVYIPIHSGSLRFVLNIKQWKAEWVHSSYSERYTTTTNETANRFRLYPYFMNDLHIGRSLKIRKLDLSLTFSIYNLFNETYHTILYRPMPGINYMFVIIFKL